MRIDWTAEIRDGVWCGGRWGSEEDTRGYLFSRVICFNNNSTPEQAMQLACCLQKGAHIDHWITGTVRL